LLDLSAACFVEGRRKTLITSFGIAYCHYARAFWSMLLQEFGVSHVGQRGVRATIKEFLLHPPFREGEVFYGLLGCVLSCGTFGGEERSAISWQEKGSL